MPLKENYSEADCRLWYPHCHEAHPQPSILYLVFEESITIPPMTKQFYSMSCTASMPIANSYYCAHPLQPPLSHGSAAHCKFIKILATSSKALSSSSSLTAMHGLYTQIQSHKSSNGVPRCSSASPPSALRESDRSKLKEQLLSTIASTGGTLNEDCMLIISSLEKLNPNPDITLVPHLYTGCFEGICGSFRGTGRPGEGQKLIGKSVTLGRAAFNAFKPTDTDIQLKLVYNHVGTGAHDAYYLLIPFSVNHPGAGPSDDPTMEGLLITRAAFNISDSSRMDIKFESSTMVPLNPQKDLHFWLQLFKDENPTMDEGGSVTAHLPPTKGFVDYLYLDDNLRITRGNRGGVAVVKRLPEAAIRL